MSRLAAVVILMSIWAANASAQKQKEDPNVYDAGTYYVEGGRSTFIWKDGRLSEGAYEAVKAELYNTIDIIGVNEIGPRSLTLNIEKDADWREVERGLVAALRPYLWTHVSAAYRIRFRMQKNAVGLDPVVLHRVVKGKP